ncbi:hypothetical protein PENSPDRAFT_94957 [Peniophora sp. CONT]|nr:hypothetical protein PENSPDRAFT_94957 [Peniophora sp. CONT]
MSSVNLTNQLASDHNLAALNCGIWFHELVTASLYDWKLFRRPDSGRPLAARLAKWTYLACRILCFIFVICDLISSSFPQQLLDCRVLLKVGAVRRSHGFSCCGLRLMPYFRDIRPRASSSLSVLRRCSPYVSPPSGHGTRESWAFWVGLRWQTWCHPSIM